MPAIVVELSEETLSRWTTLARRASVPVETWLALCGCFGAALDLPITRVVVREPRASAARGVAWEVGEFPSLAADRRPKSRR